MGLPPIVDKGKVGIDIEIFGGKRKRLHRATGKFACMAVALPNKDVYVLDKKEMVRPALQRVNKATWVFHNAPFDLNHLRRWSGVRPRDRVICTLNWERLLYSGYYDSFGLRDVVRRYFRKYLDKETRDEFSEGFRLDRKKIRYNARDALYCLQVSDEQEELMDKDDRWIWKNVDLPATWAVLDFQGFPIDKDKWLENAERNKKKYEEIKEFLGFNPNSSPQTIDAMRREGYVIKSSAAGVLSEIAYENETAEMVLQAREASKRFSTYGFAFADNFIESDGRVYASYTPTRASTGRTASSNPPMQQIPKEELFRSCFIAPKGWRVLSLDWSQQEVRVMAQMSQDEMLIEAFWSGDDIYTQVARIIFSDEGIQRDSDERDHTKAVVLGLLYGLTPIGLARQLGIMVDDAEYLVSGFFRRFRGVDRFIKRQRHEGYPYVTTIWGRKFWSNPYSRKSLNNVINSPMQGGAADMMKYALGIHHKRWRKKDGPYSVTQIVHDEFVLLAHYRDAKRVANEMREIMLNVMVKMLPDLPPGVDLTIGRSWAG